MARKKDTVVAESDASGDGSAVQTLPDGSPFPTDAAAAVQRDRSGQPFSTIGSEGAANFGAVTAAARAVLEQSGTLGDANDSSGAA